jgi:hypothetical protein
MFAISLATTQRGQHRLKASGGRTARRKEFGLAAGVNKNRPRQRRFPRPCSPLQLVYGHSDDPTPPSEYMPDKGSRIDGGSLAGEAKRST